MSGMALFEFSDRPVRVINLQGEPWFVANDVACVLGYVNPRDAIAKHCKAPKLIDLNTVASRDGIRGNPLRTIIPERDVYRLVMRSHLPGAEQFEEWVVGTVLPSIRKNGGYLAGQEREESPELILARALQVANSIIQRNAQQLQQVTAVLEQQRPAVEFYEAVAATTDEISIGDLARVIGAGQNRLFRFLRNAGVLMQDNRPYQAYIDRGYFRVIERLRTDLRSTNTHLNLLNYMSRH